MVLFLDSLGQCVSALSKRFAAAESIRDTVNCLHHSHREKHSDVRHRKDSHHQQEDILKLKVGRQHLQASSAVFYSGYKQLACKKNIVPPCWLLKRSLQWVYSLWNMSNADNQWQSPHLDSKEAKLQLRFRPRAQPQTERRAEGSIQGARDHSTW